MPTFTYQAKDKKGELIKGTMEAENKSAVVNRLQATGFFPLNVIADDKKKSQSSFMAKFSGGKVKTADLATFNRQLADLLSAGVPLVKSLGIILNQTSNDTLKAILQEINNDVSQGDTLAKALSKHPKTFSKLYCAMVKAGEIGGMLDNVLQRLADFSEEEESLKGKIKSALAYPVIMVLAGTVAIIVLMTVVIPKIVTIFAELQQAMPLPTLILIKITDFLSSYWWILLAGSFFLGSALWKWSKTLEGKKVIDVSILKIPLLGTLIVKKEVAGFARTLGSLLHNGVSILNSLEITEEVIQNYLVKTEVEKIAENITQGTGIAAPLRMSKIFPPVVVNMIAIGEETGKLDEVLLKIAHSYEIEVDRSVKLLTSMIEPIIILVMGCVVAFIVIAMLLPIFNIDPTV